MENTESPATIVLIDHILPADMAGRITADMIHNSLNILKIERLGSCIRQEEAAQELSLCINKLTDLHAEKKGLLNTINTKGKTIKLQYTLQISVV